MNAKLLVHHVLLYVETVTTEQVKYVKMVTTLTPMDAQRHALLKRDGNAPIMVVPQIPANLFAEMGTNMVLKSVMTVTQRVAMGNFTFVSNFIRCYSDCLGIETGFECKTTGSACTAICGDGLKLGLEECDDGNKTPGEG